MTTEETLPPNVHRPDQPELWLNEEGALATFICSSEQIYSAVTDKSLRVVYRPLTRPFDGTTEPILYLPDLDRVFRRRFLADGEIAELSKSATVAVVSGAGGTLLASGLTVWSASLANGKGEQDVDNLRPIDLSTAEGLAWAKPILLRLYAQGQHKECISLAEDVLAWHPLDNEVACHRICSLEHFSRYAESDHALEAVLSRKPNDPRALYLRGRHSLLNAKLQRVNTGRSWEELAIAERCLRSAYLLSPHYVAGKKDYAQALFELGKYEEALSYIADVDFVSERGEEVRTNGLALLGELYMAIDKTERGARKVVTELAPLIPNHSPSNPRGAEVVASALLRLGELDKSAAWRSLAEAIKGGQELGKRQALAACVAFISGELPK